MATINQPSSDVTLDVRQDYTTVRSENWSVDPSWKFTDSNGHNHWYDRGYVTLTEVTDASHWCDGDEGWQRHDPHLHIDESHYECSQCGEVIEPRLLPPGIDQNIPGLKHATLTGTRTDGVWVSMWLKDEAEMEACRDPEQAQRTLDEAQPERIMEYRFST